MSYNSQNLSTSDSFAKAFMDNAYPSGQVIITGSTRSRNISGSSQRSLTSRTLSEALSGDAFTRNSRLGLSNYSSFINSDIKSMVIGGAEVGYAAQSALEVIDPNGIVTSGEVQKLTGGAAFNQMLSSSLLSRNLASDLMAPMVESINSAYAANGGADVMVNGIPHESTVYTFENIELVRASSRPETGGIAIEQSMSQDEIGWLKDRLRIIKQYGSVQDSSVLDNGFMFDLPDELSGLIQNQGTYDQGAESSTTNVLDDIVKAGQMTAHLAPALIELLVYLGSSDSEISILCKTSAGGSVTSAETGSSISNFANGSMVGDHVFGRAIDVIFVSSADGTNGNDLYANGQGAPINIYRSGFEMLMDELNKLGLSHPYLLPDAICIHPDLKNELEINNERFEIANASVRVRYPGLKYVDFITSEAAKSYVHLSFGAGRCGKYSGPGTLLIDGTNSDGSEYSVDLTSGVDSAILLRDGEELGLVSTYSNEKFTMPYTGDNKDISLTRDEVFQLLNTVMVPEAAAIFTAIAIREGGGKPSAFNPDCWAENNLPLPTVTNPGTRLPPSTSNGSTGIQFPIIATSQALYDKAKEAIKDESDPQYGPGFNKRYLHNKPSLSDLSDGWDSTQTFDCSGFVWWAAYEIGLAINKSSKTVTQVSQASNFFTSYGYDWSYTQDIIDLMDHFGTKFIDPSGAYIEHPDVGDRLIPLPDYDRLFNTPGAVLVRGPDDITNEGGHVMIAKGDGTRTIVHAGGTETGLIEQTVSEQTLLNYWHVGLLPGLSDSGTGGSNSGAGPSTSSDLNYDSSDLRPHGDWSLGLFQTNMIAHGQKDFFMPIPGPGETTKGWKIGLADSQNYAISTHAQAINKWTKLYLPFKNGTSTGARNELFDYVDERAWVPLNQAYMLYTTITGAVPPSVMGEQEKLGYNQKYIFSHWGNYRGGPYYGFISNVNYSIAKQIYVNYTGRQESDLASWVLEMAEEIDAGANDGGRSERCKASIPEWIQGWTFHSPYSGGSFSDGGKTYQAPDITIR